MTNAPRRCSFWRSDLKQNPATAQLSAVVNDRFIVVPGSARGYSVRTVDSLELIADGLHELYGHH